MFETCKCGLQALVRRMIIYLLGCSIRLEVWYAASLQMVSGWSSSD